MFRLLSSTFCVMLAATLATFRACGKLETGELQKNFERIEKHLKKHVYSDDVEANLAELEDYLELKSSEFGPFKEKSLIETLQLIVSLADHSENPTCRRSDIETMKLIEKALSTQWRVKAKDYFPGRLDAMVQLYLYKSAAYCRSLRKEDGLSVSLNQIVYDNLNKNFLENLPKSNDVETDMQALEAMQKESVLPSNGALGMAMKTVLELRSTLSENSCNLEGLEIILKNDLASRAAAHSFQDTARRIERIAKHYSVEHAKMCRPVYRPRIRSKLKQLSDFTFRTVLALASYHYLGTERADEIRASSNRMRASVNESIIPDMVDFAKAKVEAQPNTMELAEISDYDPRILYQHIMATGTEDPDTKRLVRLIVGEEGFYEDKVYKTYNKYLHQPCQEYLSALGADFLADEYGNYVLAENGLVNRRAHFIPFLDYFIARAGYQVCRLVTLQHEALLAGLKEASPYL